MASLLQWLSWCLNARNVQRRPRRREVAIPVRPADDRASYLGRARWFVTVEETRLEREHDRLSTVTELELLK